MSRVKTRAVVTVYERADEAVDDESMTVETHWSSDDRVVIRVGNAKPVTVIASDLRLAIDRCSR